MSALFDFLKGKKTYIISACIIAIALLKAYLEGDTTLWDQIVTILLGGGLASLRAGVSKATE